MAVSNIDEKVLVQVCIIVRDVEKTARQYADILGFDFSWGFQTTLLHDQTHATYYGKPTDARAKLTGVGIGNIQFELLQPLVAGYLDDLLSWAAIGARTSESQIHREMVSGLDLPVGFKNGTDGSLGIATDAMRSSL